MNNLKNCAHCGKGDDEVQRMMTPGNLTPTGHPAYLVQCQFCGMSTGGFDTQEEADEAWNTRDGRLN